MKFLLSFLIGLSLSAPALADNSAEDSHVLAPEEVFEISIGESDQTGVLRSYSHDFGSARVGRTKTAHFYVRNEGRVPIFISNIDTIGDAYSHRESCPGVLLAGRRCSIRVAFRPNHIGSTNGRLEIGLRPVEDIRVYLHGRGVLF